MADWLRLVECKQTPTQIFTIFDYTKIAYLIDSGFCLREIVNDDEKPAFIPIQHEFQKIYKLYWVADRLVTVEKHGKNCNSDNYTINFYSVENQCETFRVAWQTQGIQEVHLVQNQNILILAAPAASEELIQILFFDCQKKNFIAKGIVEGSIEEAVLGPNNSISILYDNHIIAYKNEHIEQGIGRIYRDREYFNKDQQIKHHFWIQGELLIWNQKSIQVIVDKKKCQVIQQFHRIHQCVPMICGFLACDSCVVKIFKKKNGEYQLITQLNQESLIDSCNLSISPQEDIFAFYSRLSSGIVYTTEIQTQIQQNPFNPKIMAQSTYLRTKQINHQKSFDFCIFTSQQSLFAASNSSEVQLFSSNQYIPFMGFKLEEVEAHQNMFDPGVKVRTIAIHPNRPIIAVAIKKQIRVYYVTFNEVKLLKEFQVSMCGGMTFSNCGSMLSTIVTGKNGAKISIFKIDEQKNQYYLIQTMSVPKRIIKMYWSSLDNKFFCLFSEGIYQWDTLTKFKQKNQYTNFVKFTIEGGFGYEKLEDGEREELLVIWGRNNAAIFKGTEIIEEFSVKDTISIKSIFYSQNIFVFVLEDGRICSNKNFDLQGALKSSYDLKTAEQDFDIQLQQSNRIVYVSKKCNIKFFEFGKKNNDFSQFVGIQKKKILSLLGKHKKYEEAIKTMKQSYSNAIIQIKASYKEEKEKREETFKTELLEHITRENKIKDEKMRLEEIMENNLKTKEKEAMGQIKDLQRLYERKIALTTNKLLTEKEIGYRDKQMAQKNLRVIEQKHYESVQDIRKQFAEYCRKNMFEREAAHLQMMALKKDYQSRLYDLEQENQSILQHFQEKNDDSVMNLKKLVLEWENKYSECLSVKDNAENTIKQKGVENEILTQKIFVLQRRKQEVQRRSEYLTDEINKVVKVIEQKNKALKIYEKRIEDLQKSNQIMKYRVLELKQQNDPHEHEITQLKANMIEIEEENQKLMQENHDRDQKIDNLKKEKNKIKEEFEILQSKQKKGYKRYEEVIEKIRQITKSPIQQVRKELLAVLEQYSKPQNSYSVMRQRTDSPLGELNRMRDHLQVCLEQAVASNKKNQQQKIVEIKKKNRQNSELLKEINVLRIKLKDYEKILKDKDIYINRLIRGEVPPLQTSYKDNENMTRNSGIQKLSIGDRDSRSFGKSNTRETIYEKSMFKSSFWKEKRLKTEQGSRRKKSSLSMLRDKTQHQLAIAPINEQIQEYKRIIEQKDLFIEKLLMKIQNDN